MLSYLTQHPLILLLLMALISGLLVPWITRGWNSHQKALEIKTGLVADLSKSIMEIIMAVQYARVRAPNQTQEDFDKAYREWEVQSAVIGTRLEAYFPNNHIPSDWTSFSKHITDFYAIEGAPSREVRDASELALWKGLGKKTPLSSGDLAWRDLKEELLHRKSELIKRVLKDDISVLS